MKMPNGYGSVYKLSGKRRNPYIARITVGWDNNGKQLYDTVGYYSSYTKGIVALEAYHENPYDLKNRNILFKDAWEIVLGKLNKLVDREKMSLNNINCLTNAFNTHLIPLHNEKVIDIKYIRMQNIIDNAQNKNTGKPLGYTGKGYIKTVCVKIFNLVIDEFGFPIDPNPAIKLNAGDKPKSEKHKPFTDEQIAILWGLQYNDLVKVILIWIYTGLRPNELFKTEKTNIFIEEKYFITGSKTEAGRDRKIPIHHKIEHLIKYFYAKDTEYPFTTLYDNFNYGKVKREFDKLMDSLDFDHTPYDGRHTFATKMKRADTNEYILKKILGHSIQDLTERVYTHRELKDLINEVEKIN